MFERFTERARRVVVLAQEETLTLGHDRIGTEHLLLGLVREREGLASRVLASLGVTLERTRAEVVRIAGAGERSSAGEERPALRQIPFTPRAKKALELALREALGLGHNYIGTEHLLLGLVRESDGAATRILSSFDVDPETIRGEIVRMLSSADTTSQVGPDLDRSWLDFTPASALELAMRLAPLSQRITFEVRRHAEREPTFRVTCQLTGSDDAVRQLAALEADGVRAVLDRDRTVRLGRLDALEEPGSG